MQQVVGAAEQRRGLLPGGQRQRPDFPADLLTVSTAVGDYWAAGNAGGGCLAVFGINGSGRVVVT